MRKLILSALSLSMIVVSCNKAEVSQVNDVSIEKKINQY